MFNFLDLLDRSATGEPMAVSDWDFALAMAVRRLVKKYGLDWDRTHVINDDPARADAIFDAALELAIELGVYNYSTGRVVKFTPDELLMGLRKSAAGADTGRGQGCPHPLCAQGVRHAAAAGMGRHARHAGARAPVPADGGLVRAGAAG